MSEQPTARPSPGGRILGMPRTTFYLVLGGVALVGGLAYFWWRNYNAAQQAAANTAATTSANGGVTDNSGQLSVIQSELDTLLQEQAGSGNAPAGTTTTTTTGTGTAASGVPVSVAIPNGLGGWMNYTFPSQSALNTFYANIGVQNGAYPNGLTPAQIQAALSAVGASPQTGPTANPG